MDKTNIKNTSCLKKFSVFAHFASFSRNYPEEFKVYKKMRIIVFGHFEQEIYIQKIHFIN